MIYATFVAARMGRSFNLELPLGSWSFRYKILEALIIDNVIIIRLAVVSWQSVV